MDSTLIAEEPTKLKMTGILEQNLNKTGINHLVEEMCVQIDEEYGKKFDLMKAFFKGFRGGEDEKNSND
jgi:hypothetical protein